MQTASLSRCAGIFLSGFLAVFGAACTTTTHQVRVTSVSRPTPPTRELASYQIQSRTPAPADNLRYLEATRHIKTALSAQGLYEAPDAHSADLIVEIDYGIVPARVKLEEYQTPVFGSAGVAENPAEPRPCVEPKQLLGYEHVYRAVVVHEKHLSICGRENLPSSEGKPAPELWRVDVSVENESQDLRGYLPILASAAMDHIGQTTPGTTVQPIRDDDEAVGFIRKGL